MLYLVEEYTVHCLTLVFGDMTEENARCKLHDLAMFLDLGSEVSSQEQPAGDPVQTGASSKQQQHLQHCSKETSLWNTSGSASWIRSFFGHLAGGSAEERDFAIGHEHYREQVFFKSLQT